MRDGWCRPGATVDHGRAVGLRPLRAGQGTHAGPDHDVAHDDPDQQHLARERSGPVQQFTGKGARHSGAATGLPVRVRQVQGGALERRSPRCGAIRGHHGPTIGRQSFDGPRAGLHRGVALPAQRLPDAGVGLLSLPRRPTVDAVVGVECDHVLQPGGVPEGRPEPEHPTPDLRTGHRGFEEDRRRPRGDPWCRTSRQALRLRVPAGQERWTVREQWQRPDRPCNGRPA